MSRKPAPPKPAPILALDLGSSTIRAALVVDGRPQIVELAPPESGLRAVVGVDGETLALGDIARRLALSEPRAQVFAPGRLAGARYELSALEGDRWQLVPVERGPGGDVHARLAGEAWPVPRMLGALLRRANEAIGAKIERLPA